MSEEAANAAFLSALRDAFEAFRAEERGIRAQYRRDEAQVGAEAGLTETELLERPTRRFLIDRMLRALGWDPGNPGDVIEEARSWIDIDRLYFDYLGLDPDTQRPVIMVEAKGFDAELPRAPREQTLDARGIAQLVQAALSDIKAGKASVAVLAKWREWLKDLHDYVHSLSKENRSSLRRVVSSAGQWLIVFEDPEDAFVKDGPPNSALIHCFVSIDDILERHALVRRLLNRSRLVDTLGVALSLPEALAVLRPNDIGALFRGFVLVTRESGSSRRPYPTRTVIPAVIVISSGRPFAVLNDQAAPQEEPRDPQQLPQFLADLSTRAEAFERGFLQMLGRPNILAQPLSGFTGFSPDLGRNDPVPTDIAGDAGGGAIAARIRPVKFVIDVGRAHSEYIVVTGHDWFFKSAVPDGPACPFHEWPNARKQGVSANDPISEYSETTFTQSGEHLHCAHDNLRGMRDERCHVDAFDSHLCCRACVFAASCWTTDANRLPCP